MSAVETTNAAPNPGSDEAAMLGCNCPRMDNGYGRGYIIPGNFVVREGCPVHAPLPAAEPRSLGDGR